MREYPSPRDTLYGIEKFNYNAETNSYECPGGKQLKIHRHKKKPAAVTLPRDAGKVSRLRAKGSVHDRPLPPDNCAHQRIRPATSSRKNQTSGLRNCATPTAKSRSVVCRAQEPDRTAACSLAQDEVCSRTILSCRRRSELETARWLCEAGVPEIDRGPNLR